MNDVRMNDLRSPRNLSDDRVDKMLRTFFREEMPDPWPVLKAPEMPAPAPAVLRPWWKRTGRLALAASVGLMLVGYLTLASRFPRSGVDSGLKRAVSENIGELRPLHQTPRKNLIHMPVLIEESKGKDGWSFKVYTGDVEEKR